VAYYLSIFSPETYEAFSKSDRDISGFRLRQQNIASRIKIGDKFICYLTKLSRWVGVCEVQSESFVDNTPIFDESDDPFVVRFKVKSLTWLEIDKAIPIHNDRVWKHLSFTKNLDKNSRTWTGKLRNSLNQFSDKDGHFLEKVILAQTQELETFPIDEKDYKKFIIHQVHRLDKVVTVSVPQETETESDNSVFVPDLRESIRMQALLAKIGAQMGMKIWIPRNDRNAVIEEWKDSDNFLIERLPLNYDETTLKTIEQIDVLWLNKRSIVRAFEVEHTTSIYSGILRMADLLALQPNMHIKLHIVAPIERRDKVFQQIRRPVFSLLDVAPLFERCTYLSYESVQELSEQKHLSHLSDSVLDEYAEEAE
jgi:predicted RNA-binding protein with PUA-like domain